VRIGRAGLAVLSEPEVAHTVRRAWQAGQGGWIVTVNVDILRAITRDPELADLVSRASLSVADGMPLLWAARVAGHVLPGRVTGASLVDTLAAQAAALGGSVYLVGGDPGVPQAAGAALARRHAGLHVAGAESPPFGFDRDPATVAALADRVVAAAPDLVLVGLGFPKQERLIATIRPRLPRAWFLGCGAGIPFAAGQYRRAPEGLQRIGAEWLFRLVQEPRRLGRRYLAHDLPFAVDLMTQAVAVRAVARAVSRGWEV
jgi:N-acetylglucosaminyldiphosphoundecaprenol N-acetyl-beta-D-mannosaminyltransferase